jgi:hypothetical protein
MYPRQLHPEKEPILWVTSVVGEAQERAEGLLSRPTPCRSTPITTTVLHFMVRLDSEGASSVRLTS